MGNPVERCLNCEEGIRMGGRPDCEESPCQFCEQGQALAKSYGYIFDLYEVYSSYMYEKEGLKAYDAQVQRNEYVEQILNDYSGGSDEINERRNRLTTDHYCSELYTIFWIDL